MDSGEISVEDDLAARTHWNELPYLNTFGDFLVPGPRFTALVALLLAPQIMVLVYAHLPRTSQRQMGAFTGSLLLVSALAGLMFLISLVCFRRLRYKRQLALNASLVDFEPEHFVLYLRSFRRSGAVFVPNQLPTLVNRRLMGNFWDIELGLALALTEKLPVMSLGVRTEGIGSMQLQCDEETWTQTFQRLALKSKAIFMVLDDRPSTIWEFNTVISDSRLRSKLVFAMAPEQFGWYRRLRGLPSLEQSWIALRETLSPVILLPPYSKEGGLMALDDSGSSVVTFNLENFRLHHVRRLISLAIERSRGHPMEDVMRAFIPASSLSIGQAHYDEGWRAYVDPVWPVVYVTSMLVSLSIASELIVASSEWELPFFAASVAGLTAVILSTFAFTVTRPDLSVLTAQMRARRFGYVRSLFISDRFTISGWLGFYRAPGTVRAAIDVFAIVFFVFLIRTLAIEPFKVPSSSMSPTLIPGDLVVVSKSAYRIWSPVTRTPLTATDSPRRGDVVVFFYPRDISQHYVKRVVAVPGDTLAYRDKKLIINGNPVRYRTLPAFLDEEYLRYSAQHHEFLKDRPHRIITETGKPPFSPGLQSDFAEHDTCTFTVDGFSCTVPADRYFVMGDNRDNSMDSRYWGYVSGDQLVGKVWALWGNFSRASRVGKLE